MTILADLINGPFTRRKNERRERRLKTTLAYFSIKGSARLLELVQVMYQPFPDGRKTAGVAWEEVKPPDHNSGRSPLE
jgi:hypothetical protein